MSLDIHLQPGSLVSARGREWVVLPDSKDDTLILRPLGGSQREATLVYLPLERTPVAPASFPPPDPALAGSHQAGSLLRDALLLRFRAGGGPFRSFGNIAVEPRAYQLVPLLMALKQATVRLLIADDVGIGKTIEACLIARELLDRGEIGRLTVLCPPHLCEQWQGELDLHFNIPAEVVRTSTVGRLERGLPPGRSLFEVYPFTIVSLDYIKSDRRRDEFLRSCPEFVMVDEAHTCTRSGAGGRHQRYQLLKGLAETGGRHLVLLTATPHSGDEAAFSNLLGLLDPDFAGLHELPEGRRAALREQLARHFVQRRRPDIEEWQEASLFPERLTREAVYRLTGRWGQLFDDVLEYAREMIAGSAGLGLVEQRMNWWAALALLRCISSSPAAAVKALSTRIEAIEKAMSPDVLDEEGEALTLDGGADLAAISDSVPAAARDDVEHLALLASYADDLRGPAADPKLAALLAEVQALVAAGFRPVIFCRYVATAHYVAEHLAKAFPEYTVAAVTGELAPAEREERVVALAATDPRILVATDCLSEGVNLQEWLNAVVHYDLSWNPTRHEQREGRVDRFGQPSSQVRAVMLYGEDNPVDGAVLKVILRKAERIRKELGVLVPMPDDENRVSQAVMQAVLLRQQEGKSRARQLSLFEARLLPLEEDLDRKWQNIRDKVARNRTIFAQRRLRPEEVLPEWRKAMAALGGEEDVRRFVRQAAERLGAPLESRRQGFRLHLRHLPAVVRERLAGLGIDPAGPLDLEFRYPPPPGCRFIHRSHPLVAALADFLAEGAMDGSIPEIVARAGAIFTEAVTVRTVVLLVRLRCQLVISRAGQEHTMLAEEVLPVALAADSSDWLDGDAARQLLDAQPCRDMDPAARRRHVRAGLDRLAGLADRLEALALARAEALLADHRRVRDAAEARGQYRVRPVLPVDVIGVLVLVPFVPFV
ncbi:MAG: helicase-related protein [Thermodesulfobacteriota bacterium]